MEQESKKLRDSLEDIKVFEYLKDIDKLHLVSFISQIPLPIALFDQEARFLGVNQKFADIYESDALYLFDKLLNTFSTVVYAHFNEAMRYFSKNKNYFEQEFYVKGKFYLSYFKAIRNQYDEIETVVVVCSDITRLKRRENVLLQNNKKLHDHLYLDFVTGLQNAFAFEHYLNKVWQKSRDSHLSFLKIDLDNFKRFNQLNSYTAGDEVLIQLGSVLNEAIAQTEEAEIFRLNSASFVIVIEHLTEWAVVTLAERLKFAVTNEKILFGSNNEYLTASIGIYHLDPHNQPTEVDVLQKLEFAVRSAKEKGRNSLFLLKNEI
ncbi:sensor domain-containing diguanylate cyclase [Acinetobacter guillouiae]|uniref:sensor domain-containing diguanylate cyclase n=1 Tax=Acinetobacter guillouiae TaxID=106649 RepID=UPI001AEAB945|nr:diguanylate cyclase [Acinetobacter guillouiae]MBP2544339.1 diguanylate cyclase (GGDEF)-like protein [Acinetobacter guillouiae]